jgi:hypothetical protein
MEKNELKCTITITGKKGELEAGVKIEFEPDLGGEPGAWDSGAADLISKVLDVLAKNR